jgi:hypothetical protein
MNGFNAPSLDEDAFGEKSKAGPGFKTFDAFRMLPPFHPVVTLP